MIPIIIPLFIPPDYFSLYTSYSINWVLIQRMSTPYILQVHLRNLCMRKLFIKECNEWYNHHRSNFPSLKNKGNMQSHWRNCPHQGKGVCTSLGSEQSENKYIGEKLYHEQFHQIFISFSLLYLWNKRFR